jgi:aminopeptidase N
MDEYFLRHDGQAVTCDDFVAAMAAASGFDFTPFMTWYRQAGTPHVSAQGEYDAGARRYTLTLTQRCAPTPGQPDKAPYLIPFAVGLMTADGCDMDLGGGTTTRVLQFTQPQQSFVFESILSAPTPSLLRDFSAPVILDYAYTEAELIHLLAHDTDSFNRWEAGQRLFGQLILNATARIGQGQPAVWPASVLDAVRRMLTDRDTDPAFVAEVLTLPSEATLAEQMDVVDPEALYQARSGLARFIGQGLATEFAHRYAELAPQHAYQPDPADMGQRRLRNLCLGYLNERDDSPENQALAIGQFASSDNMTDQFAALAVLANTPGDAGKTALADFYTRWQHEALVVDKWLAVQATSRLPDTLATVQGLTTHPAFERKNPNKVYSLLRGFGSNHRHFHAGDGSGYRFIAEQITLLDPINPQVASRLARCFDRWKKFDPARQAHARAALEGLNQIPTLSGDVREVVGKALG